MPMNLQGVGARFQEDHRLLDASWERFVRLRFLNPVAARGEFEAFREALERHMAWEDDLLFPEFARRAGARSELLAAMLTWEHRGLRSYLARIWVNRNLASTEAELEAVAFAGMLAGHNRREETAVYPDVDRVLGPGLAAAIAARTVG